MYPLRGGICLREAVGRVSQSCLLASIQRYRLVHVTFLLMQKKCNYDKTVPKKSHLEVAGGL